MSDKSPAHVDLSVYQKGTYTPGAGKLKQVSWYLINSVFFKTSCFPVNGLKRSLLRLFGARVGKGVVIKPSVNIKYPWKLEVGDHTWIGENVWIDNLVMVRIGKSACLSQGAMLLCGNHNYSKRGFDLITGEITIGDGAWIGARALVGPGVTVATHAVLSVQSVATSDLDPWTIYRGNPAMAVKKRSIGE